MANDTEQIEVYKTGKVIWQGKEYRCALGRSGVTHGKKEGDGATPIGCFPIREVFYRADRVNLPSLPFPTHELKPNDGWCDDISDPNYNKFVKMPYPASHEQLWREDNLYDIIVILGYNDDPPIPGLGSAIFMHVARPEFTPTAGCIALAVNDIIEILSTATKNTTVCVNDADVKPLFFDSYLATIKNSVGSRIFQSFFAEINGDKRDIINQGQYACGVSVSGILLWFGLIKERHASIASTICDMKKSGWVEVKEMRPGSVLRWEPELGNGEVNEHLGFYIGQEKAISNSRDRQTLIEHHWTYGEENGQPKRKVIAIYWHPKLEQKYSPKSIWQTPPIP